MPATMTEAELRKELNKALKKLADLNRRVGVLEEKAKGEQ